MDKEWLKVKDAQVIYNMGRDLTVRLFKLLPFLTIGDAGRGKQMMVNRKDIDAVLLIAQKDRLDLWQLVKTHTPESFAEWMRQKQAHTAA